MKARARVMVFVQVPQEQRAVLEEAYRQISESLKGTPGLLGNELLCSNAQPSSYVVLSEWDSMESFRDWEQGPVHRGRVVESLRQYTTGAAFYEVLAAY